MKFWSNLGFERAPAGSSLVRSYLYGHRGSPGAAAPNVTHEEIDVVSLGDKNLPTNPTARDYRHLQSEVASKIRTAASSRTTSNGTYGSGGGGTHHHHGHYQRHQSHHHDGPQGQQGGAGHHHHGIYPTPAGSTTISGANTPVPSRSGGASAASSPPPTATTPSASITNRKRPAAGGSSSQGGSSKRSAAGGHHTTSKRMRIAHAKRDSGRGCAGGSSSASSAHTFDPAAQALADELDTVEKRNLHNNLERQRRIGLKNLFEELKRQIPHLRDKDRAPKVNILREAATLCNRLNHEAEQVNELRQRQVKLYERVRFLRASMHNQRAGME
uniref:BHLH domain-containing protein n=1 Tax=Anopheles dirus TaxID=7168 RepID=A0A182N0X8_9DIPT